MQLFSESYYRDLSNITYRNFTSSGKWLTVPTGEKIGFVEKHFSKRFFGKIESVSLHQIQHLF